MRDSTIRLGASRGCRPLLFVSPDPDSGHSTPTGLIHAARFVECLLCARPRVRHAAGKDEQLKLDPSHHEADSLLGEADRKQTLPG